MKPGDIVKDTNTRFYPGVFRIKELLGNGLALCERVGEEKNGRIEWRHGAQGRDETHRKLADLRPVQ